jgi:4-hydroxybenzoate polyprenyltransferase
MFVTHESSGPAQRWWIYQRERFPLVAYGILIAAFSFSAVSFSSLLRQELSLPSWKVIVTAYLTCLILFLQLRIADEFKDFEEDSRYRPYRPVPRGLVKLSELGALGLSGAAIQFGLALWLSPKLLPLLVLTWGYVALMTREFFVREWIRERPITYLWTHMLIIPLADLYATACDWRSVSSLPPDGLWWFIAVSFFNGVTLELGRKIRAEGDEEVGVRSYSALWGRRNATFAWLGALLVTAACAIQASAKIRFLGPVALTLGVLVCVGWVFAARFSACPERRRAKMLEHFSGAWSLALYLCLGAVPLVWQMTGAKS